MTEPSNKKTPLYEQHLRDGGKMVPFAGYSMPVQYKDGLVVEHRAVRTNAGLFDVSHMGELALAGAGAAALVNRLITNDASKLDDGGALYTCACNEGGTILDDLIVYRRSAQRWLIVCNASNREKIVGHVSKHAAGVCDFEDQSEVTALIALQGPKAMEIAGQVGGAELSKLKSFHFAETTLAGVSCTASRTGYTGEDGLEIFCANEDAPALWDGLLEAGRDHGLVPVGLGARDTLRLEARLSLYGNEIDETTNPLEAGLAWVVKLDKADFIGKDALMAVKSKGLSRRIAGFEVTGRGIARHGYPLLDTSGKQVGVCTSGSPGPTVGKNIGLGYLPIEMTEIGTKFVVDCRGRTAEAVVLKTPFYKR